MSDTSARDAILHAVRAARPPAVARPGPWQPVARGAEWKGDLTAEFRHTAAAAGADVLTCSRAQLDALLSEVSMGAGDTWSHAGTPPATKERGGDPRWTADLELYLCEAELGVAENGAVWIASDDEHRRAALFLAQRVVIVVAAHSIVPDLHVAYDRLDVRAHTFGVLVAGPSKTADIEQSLVIGAHGPKALTVVVVTEDESGMRV
jgi:L-lactate dehydrogenase complex protein LldG